MEPDQRDKIAAEGKIKEALDAARNELEQAQRQGDLAKAGRTFEATSLSIDAAAKNSADASKQTSVVMANFAKATKPLPTWLRIGLAVAPSAAQTAFPLWSMFAK